MRVFAASVIALAVAGAVVGLAAWHGSRTPTRSHVVQPAPPKKMSYAQLVAANYKVLTPKRTNRLLRFADAAYACMSKQLELGKPRPQRTKIVMALGPGTSAHAVAQVGVRCAAKIGDPPAGSSLALRAAKTAISRGHCKVGRITKAYSAKVKTGLVISQSPAAGKHLKNGAKVNLTLSRGRRPRRL